MASGGAPPRAGAHPMTVRSEATVEERSCLGLGALAAAVARREISSVEAVKGSPERIEATQSTLNTFRCVLHERALADARQADRRLRAGETAPLLGVPVAIKDDTDLAGETTPFGCVGEFEPKTEDSEVVPSSAGLRRMKGFEVSSMNRRNPTEIMAWIASVRAFRRGGRLSPNKATSAPKIVRMSTHSSSEPS